MTNWWFLSHLCQPRCKCSSLFVQLCYGQGRGNSRQVKAELEQPLMADLSSSLQYISPQSGEAPKSRSLERKQQDPVVLTKWRHSTYLLDLNDKVSVEMLQLRCAVSALAAHTGGGSVCLFTARKVLHH